MSFFKKDRDGNSVPGDATSHDKGDLSSQIRKIAEHLVFLEKKLDTLIEKSGQGQRPFRPSFGGNGGGNGFNRRPGGRPGGFNNGPRSGGFNNGPRRSGGFGGNRPHRNDNGPSGFHKKFSSNGPHTSSRPERHEER